MQVGTAFLACEESNALPVHKEKLFSPKARYTTLTRAFSGRLARGIVSLLSEQMEDHQKELAPFPFQSTLMGQLRKAAIAQQKTDAITFWCGQIAPLLVNRNAGGLFDLLIRDTKRVLEKMPGNGM